MKTEQYYKKWTEEFTHSQVIHDMVEESIEQYEARFGVEVDKDIVYAVVSEMGIYMWDYFSDTIYDVIEENK